MHILNTRPIARADTLTQALMQAGHVVSQLPLVTIEPLAIVQQEVQLLKQLSSMAMVIVVSPTAAQFGIQQLRSCYPSPHDFSNAVTGTTWVAVGTGTQAVLAKADINATIPVNENSEGLLKLPIIQRLIAGQELMLWCGLDGRDLLQQYFLQRNVTLHQLCLYQRLMPANLKIEWQQLLQRAGFPDIILISSATAWKHWCTIAGVYAYSPIFLVLGERLFTLVKQTAMQFNKESIQIVLLDNLQPKHVMLTMSRLISN